MTFDNIISNPNCSCLVDAVEDSTSKFALKTNKAKIAEVNFKSKWEKDDNSHTDCKKVCSKKGVSLSIINEDNSNLNKVVDIYKKIFPLAPGYKPVCSIVTLGDKNGLVKSTPSLNNVFHHDFYKCDAFDFNKINYISSIPLNE